MRNAALAPSQASRRRLRSCQSLRGGGYSERRQKRYDRIGRRGRRASEGALLQILLGHDTQGGGGEGVEGDRGTERRDERPPEVKASPISHFDRESRLSLSIIAKKSQRRRQAEDVLQRARAAAQQARSLTYI